VTKPRDASQQNPNASLRDSESLPGECTVSWEDFQEFLYPLGLEHHKPIASFFYSHPFLFRNLLVGICKKTRGRSNNGLSPEKRLAVLGYLSAISIEIFYTLEIYQFEQKARWSNVLWSIKQEDFRSGSNATVTWRLLDQCYSSSLGYVVAVAETKTAATPEGSAVSGKSNPATRTFCRYPETVLNNMKKAIGLFSLMDTFASSNFSGKDQYEQLKKEHIRQFPLPKPQHWTSVVVKAVVTVSVIALSIALAATVVCLPIAICLLAGLYQKTPQEKAYAALKELNPGDLKQPSPGYGSIQYGC
jgi:hypothetical protein